MLDRGVENEKQNQKEIHKQAASQESICPQKVLITRVGMETMMQTWHEEHIQKSWLHLRKKSNQLAAA